MKRRTIRQWLLRALLACSGFPVAAFGVTLGQVDNFEDGTTDGWIDGVGGNPTNITSGGPAGTNDNYLQVSSGSFGGSPNMVIFNQSQWLGNYVTAGVAAVSMDLRSFGGAIPVPIRIAIRESTGGSNTPGYASTIAFDLFNDGQWHYAVFLLAAGSLTPINSPQPLATDLASVADFRLLSSASPALIGDTINAQIGVDNIVALSALQVWQIQYFGSTNSLAGNPNADPDGDGLTNLKEFQAGTDPTNSASFLGITSIGRVNTNILITWKTATGKTNALQRTAGANGRYSTNNFTDIFTVTNTAGSVTNYLNLGAATNSPSLYYRVRLVP